MMRRVASTPETWGICRSISTTSGMCSMTASMASPPSEASATTSAIVTAASCRKIRSGVRQLLRAGHRLGAVLPLEAHVKRWAAALEKLDGAVLMTVPGGPAGVGGTL